MTSHLPFDHFEGKSVVDHLREARTRGQVAAAESHGAEMLGHQAAACDAAKDTALALLVLWAICSHLFAAEQTLLILFSFACGWVIWKTGRSALLAWARMERLHRLIEEERWEIEHHRQQEREELSELYRAKGLSGKLLEEVIDILMADDNRLLRVMLEEELGVALETDEHPLKQAAGAGIGALCSGALIVFAYWAYPPFALPCMALACILSSALIGARLERNRPLSAIVWNLAIAILTAGSVYFIGQILTAAP